MHALVHVGHEFMEMCAALAPDRACLEEQVHQHGIAAADLAMDVEALDRVPFRVTPAEEPAERGGLAYQMVRGQPLVQPIEPRDQRRTRPLSLDLACRDEGGVVGA